jgi:hypothetical protein
MLVSSWIDTMPDRKRKDEKVERKEFFSFGIALTH